MTETAKFTRIDGLLAAEVGDELLMMNIEQGSYFNLNSVAARIWSLLATPVTTEELVDALTAEYEIDQPNARAEVERFMAALRTRGLLVTNGAATA